MLNRDEKSRTIDIVHIPSRIREVDAPQPEPRAALDHTSARDALPGGRAPEQCSTFLRFQTQNRDYLDTLEGTNENIFGFELGAPPNCESR